MKHLQAFFFILFWSFSAFSQVWDYEELVRHLGYSGSYPTNDLISDSDKKVFEDYRGYGYNTINSYLRGLPGNYSNVSYSVAILDSNMANFPELPSKLILFRGDFLAYRGGRPFEKNEILTEKAYLSTTTLPRVAFRFSLQGIFWIIYSTQRSFHGIAIHSSEREVLLPRGLTLKVMDIRPIVSRNMNYLGLAQICDSPLECEDTISNEYVKKVWETKWP